MRNTKTWRKYLEIDLAGGMNTREDPHYLRGKEFSILRNFRKGEGGIEQRPGWTKNTTRDVDAMGWCLGGFAYKTRAGTFIELLVGDGAWGDERIYRTNTDPPSALTEHDSGVWDDTNQASLAQWRDDCYICVGSTGGAGLNLRYDGTQNAIYAAGMAAPAAPTVAADGAGNVNEERYYRVVFHDTVKGYYSAPGTSASFTASSQKVKVSALPTFSGTGRTIQTVIEVSLDDSTWYLLSTNASDPTYDNTADITEYDAAPTRYETIPVCKYVVSFPDGILLFGNDVTNSQPARVVRSQDADKPENKSTTSVIVGVPGEPITGMIRWGNGVLVAKRDSLHYVPQDASSSQLLLDGIGCVAGATMQVVEGGVAFLSQDGPRYFDGTQAPFVGGDTYGQAGGSRSFVLKRTWATVAKNKLDRAFSSLHRTGATDDAVVCWYVTTDTTTGATGGRKWHSTIRFVWDYRRNEVSYDNFYCWAAWHAPVASSEEYRVHGCFPYGFVGRLDSGVGDGAGSAEHVYGGVLSATATSLTTDSTSLNTTGDGHRGVRLHIWSGTGADVARFVNSNDGSTFYLGDPTYDDGSFSTVPDTTSKWVLGREPAEFEIPGINAGDLGVAFRAVELQVHLAPESN